MKSQNNLSNDIQYALQQTQLNIEKELKNYIDNQTRAFYLHHFSHMRQYLPQRFLLKLTYNKPKQVRLSAMTSFEWLKYAQDVPNSTAMTINESSLYPINKTKSKLDSTGRLKIVFSASQAFQFFYDYFDFSLQLIKNKDQEMLQWFYNQLVDLKDCHIILNFEDGSQITQSTVLKNKAKILPINAQILDKTLSPELSFDLRCPLKQIYSHTGSKYVTSISIITPSILSLNKIANHINKSFTFTNNIIAVYNLARDFSITQVLDAHHNEIALVPKILSDFKLYQPLSMFINEEKYPVYNSDKQVCFDDENQKLSIISKSNNSIYIDGLWTKPFTDINIPIVCNDPNITASIELLKSFNQTIRPSIATLQNIVTNLMNVKTNMQSNNSLKQICSFLFTQQLDLNHAILDKLQQYINFDNGNIRAKKDSYSYIAWKVKYVIDLFIKNNKNYQE